MKPLIRWTVGSVCETGLEILEYSVNKMMELYNFCDYVVCYNNIAPLRLKKINVPILDQKTYESSFYSPPIDELWKIYPPRLRMESHEIVMDNDLIVINKVPQIDQFFKSNSTMLLAGGSGKRWYGQYDKLVPDGFIINSGIYGMPPNFDFSAKINQLCGTKPIWKQSRNEGLFDDQGIIAGCLMMPDTIIIPPSEILNCDVNHTKKMQKANGYHFINSNRGCTKFWNEFCTKLY